MAESLIDEMLAEARENFVDGNYKVSEPILNQLILQNTRNPEVYQMLATIYYDKGQFNKAIKTFKRALEIDPAYTDASVGLSIILNDLGKYEEGKQVFQEAQKLLDRKAGKWILTSKKSWRQSTRNWLTSIFSTSSLTKL